MLTAGTFRTLVTDRAQQARLVSEPFIEIYDCAHTTSNASCCSIAPATRAPGASPGGRPRQRHSKITKRRYSDRHGRLTGSFRCRVSPWSSRVFEPSCRPPAEATATVQPTKISLLMAKSRSVNWGGSAGKCAADVSRPPRRPDSSLVRSLEWGYNFHRFRNQKGNSGSRWLADAANVQNHRRKMVHRNPPGNPNEEGLAKPPVTLSRSEQHVNRVLSRIQQKRQQSNDQSVPRYFESDDRENTR